VAIVEKTVNSDFHTPILLSLFGSMVFGEGCQLTLGPIAAQGTRKSPSQVSAYAEGQVGRIGYTLHGWSQAHTEWGVRNLL